MKFDSIKVTKEPQNDFDAVTLGYTGDKNKLLIGNDFVDSINKIKQSVDPIITGSGLKPITNLDNIKGKTFLNVATKETVTLPFDNQTNESINVISFADIFIEDKKEQTIDKWNFDVGTEKDWDIQGDNVKFVDGVVKFNEVEKSKGYSILTSKVPLDVSKVDSIVKIEITQNLSNGSLKYLFSNNQKSIWFDKNLKKIYSTTLSKENFKDAFTIEDIVKMSNEDKQLLISLGGTLDVAICCEYSSEDSQPISIDLIKFIIKKEGYWYPILNLPDGQISLKKFNNRIELTNNMDSTEDFKISVFVSKNI